MPATATLEHSRKESLDSVDHTVKVNSDYPIPIFVAQARNVLLSTHSGVVAQNRNRTEPGFSFVSYPSVGRAVAHVEFERFHRGQIRELGFSVPSEASSMSASATFAPD